MAEIKDGMYTHTVVFGPAEEKVLQAFVKESGIKNFSGALRLIVNEWSRTREVTARILTMQSGIEVRELVE
jgi:hypothetical protein